MTMTMLDEECVPKMGEAARAMEAPHSVEETLAAAAQLAVELVPGCEQASVSILRPRLEIEHEGATDNAVRLLDQLQVDLGEGPCVTAIFDQEIVSCPDLGAATDWPKWSAEAVRRTDVRSMLCVRLFTHGRERVGALNLFATKTNGFSERDTEIAEEFGAHLAVAMVDAQAMDDARAALNTRSAIGQAQGILMERFSIDAMQAFAVLQRISQHSNRKLRDVALGLIATRRLPEDLGID